MTEQTAAALKAAGGASESKILLSICIPTYNRARYLPEALESIIYQLTPDVELLVYDTGSSDGTQLLMENYARRVPSLRFFSLPSKRGFDETVLLLLKQCRGEYVWLFGSDDVLKIGAIAAVRDRILKSPVGPAFFFLNHEVVDHEGKRLIGSNVRRATDRKFGDARRAAAWLGLHLGYISACVFRKPSRADIETGREFIGTLWMGLYFNLISLSSGGPAHYVGRPLIRARRNPGNVYDYAEVFVRKAKLVFSAARRSGLRRWTIYRAMNKTVRAFYFRMILAWRCDDPGMFHATFPAMLQACWMYPWFWLLIAPVRLVPACLIRVAHNYLRGRRERRNRRAVSGRRAVQGMPVRLD